MFRRILFATAALLVVASAEPAASAPPKAPAKAEAKTPATPAVRHAFVEVLANPYNVIYLDAGDLRRVDGEIEFRQLTVQPTQSVKLAPGKAPEVYDRRRAGEWERVRLDCDWGVTRRLERISWSGSPSQLGATRTLSGEPSFFFREPAAVLCQPGFKPPPDAPATAEAAVAAGEAKIDPQSIPPFMVARRERPPAPIILAGGPRAFALAATSAKGRAAFLDWSRLTRDGGVATAPTLWIIGPETDETELTVALRQMRFDCAAGTAEIVSQTLWSRTGERYGDSSGGVLGVRPVASLPATRALWEMACHGEAAADDAAPDVNSVLTSLRATWPPPPPRAVAPPEPRAPLPVVTSPDWIRKPGAEDLARLFPPAALEAGIEGRSTIECLVTAEGSLTNCAVVSESPPGAGFGAAHVEAARLFRMRPKTKEGVSVEGARVRVTLVWGLGV